MPTQSYTLYLTLLTLLYLSATAYGQEEIPPLPMDPDAVTGELDNGFTYILRKNEVSPGRADVTLAVKVGSSVEGPKEAGFSNLLSHMAFKGIRSRSEEELAAFFSARGLTQGRQIAPKVTHDETVYSIQGFPLNGRGDLDDLLWILKGWCHEMKLDSRDMDTVSTQIIENMDGDDSAELRVRTTILERALPLDHPYGGHAPIGNPKILRAFPYQTLRDFYAKWYRPDLQGIVIVGDISPREVEQRIKAIFSNIPQPTSPVERTYPEVPEHSQPQAIVLTERAVHNTTIAICWAHNAALPAVKASAAGLLMDYTTEMISMMMEERLRRITELPDAPFVNATFRYIPFLEVAITEDAFTLMVTAPGVAYQKGLEAAAKAVRDARESGFTEEEYQKARKHLLDQVENYINLEDTLSNRALSERYTTYFTRGGYAPGIKLQHQLLTTISEQVTLEVVNKNFRELIGEDQSLTLVVVMPRKFGIIPPSGNTVLRVFERSFR